MRLHRTFTALGATAALCAIAVAPAASQETTVSAWSRHVALDTVIGYQDFFREVRDWPAQGVVDVYAAVEPSRGWQVAFRPKLWRTQGNWEVLVDQVSVGRDFTFGTKWRVEAGRFPSTIGYGATENRPSLNAGVLWWHRPYYMPLPALGRDLPMVSLVSMTYPWGAHIGTSTRHWDARAAVADRAPVEFWHGEDRGARSPQVIFGGGVTPVMGVRLGAATASGQLVRGALGPASRYRMINVEGELAFGHTKASGEWTRDRFLVSDRDAEADGWSIQVQRTLTPRWFAHARATAIRSSASLGSSERRRYRSLDTTVGFRIDPEVTIRVAHAALKSFSGRDFDHQVGVSLMWARRWW